MTATPPPFDAELAEALAERDDLVVTTLAPDEIGRLRRRTTMPDAATLTRDGTFVTTMHQVPNGPEILLLRPASATGHVPVLFHLHGGGFVTGSMYDDVVPLAGLAEQAGCAIASTEYRLAPEHPFPAALDDAYAGLVWLVEHAGGLGLDADLVVVEGVSAGGGLAAATALRARDRGGPRIAGQLLICPALDHRNDSASGRQMVGRGAWDRSANAVGWGAYLPDAVVRDVAAGPDGLGHASPARATDLSGLPPMFLDVGSAETFRDEVVAYAERTWLAGGEAELHVWPGGFHGFDQAVPGARLSRDAREARARWLDRLLTRRRH